MKKKEQVLSINFLLNSILFLLSSLYEDRLKCSFLLMNKTLETQEKYNRELDH